MFHLKCVLTDKDKIGLLASIYLSSTPPQIYDCIKKCFTIFTCARPVSVSFLCNGMANAFKIIII